MPLVVIDRPLAPEYTARTEVDTVLLDNADAAYQLTEHLLTNGYRRIGVLVGADSQTGRERVRGYKEALRAHHLTGASDTPSDTPSDWDEHTPAHVRQVEPKVEAGYAAALELLDVTPRLDALLAGNSLLAAGAWRAIHERGLAIPHDIALVSFDESAWEDLVEPPITLSVQPTYAIGATAADLLLGRIADSRRPSQQVTLQAHLLVRGSSAPRGYNSAMSALSH